MSCLHILDNKSGDACTTGRAISYWRSWKFYDTGAAVNELMPLSGDILASLSLHTLGLKAKRVDSQSKLLFLFCMPVIGLTTDTIQICFTQNISIKIH